MSKNAWRQERQFGVTVGLVLVAISGWLFWRGYGPAATAAPAVVGALLVLFGVGYPRALVYPNRAWMALAEALSWVMTRVILGLLFFLVFTPLGAWRRMRGLGPAEPAGRRATGRASGSRTRTARRTRSTTRRCSSAGCGATCGLRPAARPRRGREPMRGSKMAKIQVLVEFWEFLRYNKKYWIAPIVVFLVLAGLILVLAQATPLAPFIYTSSRAARRMTAILGISAFYHDSAACLVIDGEIVAAAQEERFTRKKHDPGFPSHACRYCLSEAGLKPSELTLVGFYEKPLTKFDRLLDTYLDYAPRGWSSFIQAMPLWMKEKLWMGDTIRRELANLEAPDDDKAAKQLAKAFPWKVMFGDHHESHAASAFYPSPFEEAAIVTVDGVGEWATASLGLGRGIRAHAAEAAALPRLARPALQRAHLLHRLQGELGRVQGDGPGPVRRAALPAAAARPHRPHLRRRVDSHGPVVLQLLPGPDDDRAAASTRRWAAGRASRSRS